MLRVVHDETIQEAPGGRATIDELLREGAQRILAPALEAEVTEYLERHRGERDERRHALVVRNGQARARQLVSGTGVLTVRAPRVDDRRRDETGNRQRFTSKILPPYMRRSPSGLSRPPPPEQPPNVAPSPTRAAPGSTAGLPRISAVGYTAAPTVAGSRSAAAPPTRAAASAAVPGPACNCGTAHSLVRSPSPGTPVAR